MSIIVISRMPYSKGKEIAVKVARHLNHQCLSRDDLAAMSDQFNIPATEILRALHGAPSFMDRFTNGMERYHAFIREALLERLQQDNIVYHGLAGHVFVKDVKNILKVGIVANAEDRIQTLMDAKNYSWEKAKALLEKEDKGQSDWAYLRYGIDTRDPKLYDIILHVDSLSIDDTVETLLFLAQKPTFQTTPETRDQIADLLLAAKIQHRLVRYFPKAAVTCEAGKANVRVAIPRLRQDEIMAQIKQMTASIDGINKLYLDTRGAYHPE